MEKLHDSGLAGNTLVVFTADHATYVDDEYILSFYPENTRYDVFCDTMPLMFYYEGITPEVIDAGGRNSLDLAPTICDLLDVTAENYYLGETLFAGIGEIDNDFDTVTCFGANMWSTYQAKVGPLETGQKNVLEKKKAKQNL